MADDLFKSVTIPKFLIKLLLEKYPDEVDDFKTIPKEKQYEYLLQRGCLLRKRGYSQQEIQSNLWVLSLERFRPHITENMLEEIVQRAVVEDIHGLLQNREKIELKNWTFVPEERHIYFKGRLVFKMNRDQWWVFDILIERYRQSIPKMRGSDAVMLLDEKLDRLKKGENDSESFQRRIVKHKASRNLRDWAFRMGNSGDRAYGTLVRTTKGRDAEVFLNLDWEPTEDFFLSE